MFTAHIALNAISPKNRDMDPQMVFLMFIPCLGIFWFIFIVLRVKSSLEKEFADRGLRCDGDFGMLMGLLTFVPLIGIVFHIMWHLKVSGYVAQLASSGGGKRIKRIKHREDDDD